MYYRNYQILDQQILFKSNIEEVFDDQSVFKDLTLCQSEGATKFNIIYQDTDKVCLNFNIDTIALHAPWREIKSTEVLKTLMCIVTHHVLQKAGYFMIHGSAIEKNGKGIILFGNSGSGKTITALKLCIQRNYSLLSNGSTIVNLKNGRINIVQSLKKNIKLRYSSFSQAFPDLVDDIFKDQVAETKPECLFNLKRYIEPEALQIQQSTFPVVLDSFHIIKLDDTVFNRTRLDPYRLKLILYSDISKYVRGSSTLLVFGKNYSKSIYVPCMDNIILYRKRIELINTLIKENIGAWYHGSLREIIQKFAIGISEECMLPRARLKDSNER